MFGLACAYATLKQMYIEPIRYKRGTPVVMIIRYSEIFYNTDILYGDTSVAFSRLTLRENVTLGTIHHTDGQIGNY